MKTLGLCIITKEIDTPLRKKLLKLEPLFDRIYVQENGVEPRETVVIYDHVEASYFKWADNFADARNALLKEVETDYWCWIDTDDELVGAENLRDVVQYMEDNNITRVFAPYEYSKNDLGEEIAPHMRERVIKTSHPYKWAGAVHETLVTDQPEVMAKTDKIKVVHHKDQSEYDASIKRNYEILLHEYAKEPRDPRITMYVAKSLFTMRKFDESIEKFVEHIRTSGSTEDIYQSWMKVSDAHKELGHYDKAIAAGHEGLKLAPEWPDAYFVIGLCYYELEDYDRCITWLQMGLAKPDPETLQIVDPTVRYRVTMMGALAELQRGKVKEAWKLVNMVKNTSPNYKLVKDYYSIFEEAYFEQGAIERANWLAAYVNERGGSPVELLDSLGALKMDIRLAPARQIAYKPQRWPIGSVVFFCGQTGETWGADTLDNGLGGSEEAVVYLSRELGHVDIYCERSDEYTDGTVKYHPWHTFNPDDTFDVFVAWRQPEVAANIKARLKLCDLHDTIEPERVEAAARYINKFLVKSQWHRDLYPNVPDDKFVIIPNGVVLEQFK